jgi:hypothetical protein
MPDWTIIQLHPRSSRWEDARVIDVPSSKQPGCVISVFNDAYKDTSIERQFRDRHGKWRAANYTGTNTAIRFRSLGSMEDQLAVKIGRGKAS